MGIMEDIRSKMDQMSGDELNLVNLLNPDYEEFVDNGSLSVENAITLSHLWQSKQEKYLNQAKTMQPNDFKLLIQSVIKDEIGPNKERV